MAHPRHNTRAQLIKAATSLFAEHGIAATTLAMIAERAELTPAMVHYHFRDRDELIDAVVEERLLPFLREVWGPVKPGDDPVETIRAVVDRMLTVIAREPWVPSTWMREILNENGLLRTRIVRYIPRDRILGLAQAIHVGETKGTLNSDMHPLLVIFSLIGLVMVHSATNKAFAQIFQRPAFSAEEIHRHITGLVLEGLSGKPLHNDATSAPLPAEGDRS